MRNTCAAISLRYRALWEMQFIVNTPVMVFREGHRDQVCDRAPSLRVAPEARGGSMTRPSTGSRSGSVRVITMEIIRERGVQDVRGIDPGPLLRSVPLPVYEVL